MTKVAYFKLETSGTDSRINDILNQNTKIQSHQGLYQAYFNSNEDFYLKSERQFQVPSFPVYQDVKQKKASSEYLTSLEKFLKQIMPLFPQLFYKMTWINHYTEVLRPFFYRDLSLKDKNFLLLLKLDLIYKEGHGKALEQETTTHTAAYESEDLFCEILLLPQIENKQDEEGFFFPLDIMNTWTNEVRKNYALSGQWIDMELTRFFSQLFLAKGQSIYPYFPFIYQYHTMAYQLINLCETDLKQNMTQLKMARDFLLPYLEEIAASLKKEKFSPEMLLFQKLQQKISPQWQNFCADMDTQLFLNDINQQREFQIVNKS